MKKLLSTALVLAGATLPAAAQTIYLPHVQNETLGGNQVRTRIWVSNTSDANRLFSTFFLAAGSDGSPVRPALTKVGVAPQATTIAATSGNLGMAEITGAPQLRYVGLLESVNGQGQVLGVATMPVVGSENVLAKDATIFLQGLQKSATRTSAVGVNNLAKEAAQCTLTFRRADGSAIGSAALITVLPLSQRYFPDALGTLGQTSLADARVQISCNQTYFAYATTLGTDGTNPVFVGPSSSGASKLTPPGVEPPVPDGAVVFRKDGQFLNAVVGDSAVEFEIPVVAGRDYKSAEVVFDFFLDRFNTNLFHTISSMRMDGVVFTLIVRGDRLRTIVDTNATSVGEGADWLLKRTYRVRAVANAETNELFLNIKRGSENIQTISMPLGRRRLGSFVANRPLRIDFSQDRVLENGAYVPLWGSKFSNLVVTVTPFASEEEAARASAFAESRNLTENDGPFMLIPSGEGH